MGFDRRGYFYRFRRVGGRRVAEYLGRGDAAEAARAEIAAARAARTARAAERDRLDRLDARLAEFDELAELLARAALIAAGFHRHARGSWRRRRVPPPDAGPGQASDRP